MLLTAAKKFVFGAYGIESPNTARVTLPMGLPASLLRKDLPTIWGADPQHYTQYVLSPKADGCRVLVGMFRWNGNDVGFTMDRKGAAKKLPWALHPDAYEGTLLDCELVEQTLWIFDAILIHGHELRSQAYHHRLVAACLLLERLSEEGSFTVTPWAVAAPQAILHTTRAWSQMMETPRRRGEPLAPPAAPKTSVVQSFLSPVSHPTWRLTVKPIWYHTRVEAAVNWTRQMGLKEDGLVYTPVTRAVPTYRAEDMFKWKEASHHTVDFLVRVHIPLMELYVVDELNAPQHYATVPFRSDGSEDVPNNAIYECRWDITHLTWYLMHRREDKSLPNARLTVDRTCENIRENLQQHELLPCVVNAPTHPHLS